MIVDSGSQSVVVSHLYDTVGCLTMNVVFGNLSLCRHLWEVQHESC